ncbi:membrane protein [Streptomyces malachitofuscus]|nr:membrane protein [Streptomyces malachitofuscus]
MEGGRVAGACGPGARAGGVSHPAFTVASYGGGMTQVTPPGWYPDPGQTNEGPATERWWDGAAWTDQVRPAGSAAAWGPPAPGTAAGAAYPAYPVYPAPPPPGRGHRVRYGIAVAVAVAVLASIGVGVYALTDDGGGGGTTTSQGPGGRDDGPDGDSGGSGGSGGEEPEPDGSEAPRVESGSVTDALSGISLPVPKGWYGQELQVGAAVTSKDAYDCPGNTSKKCTKGGAYSAPALALGARGSTAEEVAKADIAANAEESYGGDSYGKITSHDVLASKAVTVAGQKGYLVRWKAVTSKGSDGYVQSLAFPSPAQPKQIVVVRFGVDTDQTQDVLDEITEGIEVSSGGGRGQDV